MKKSKRPDTDLTSKFRGILPGLFPGDLSSVGARLSNSVGACVMGFNNTSSESKNNKGAAENTQSYFKLLGYGPVYCRYFGHSIICQALAQCMSCIPDSAQSFCWRSIILDSWKEILRINSQNVSQLMIFSDLILVALNQP